MSNTEIREQILELVRAKGKHHVMARLIELRVSFSSAEKLIRGAYPQEPIGTLRTVIEQVIASEISSPGRGEAI